MPPAIDTLASARHLRDAGFSEKQADGHAYALAAGMTAALATKQDLRELATGMEMRFARVDARFENLEQHVDLRLLEMEKRIEIRFSGPNVRFDGQIGELSARFDGRLSDLEKRMTFRLGGMMVAAIAAFSARVKLL